MERRIGVLVNPASGVGRVRRHSAAVLTGLASRGDHVVAIEGESAAQADRMLAEAMAAGLDLLVAVGGDGTVHQALQAVVGTDTALGIVPLGTGNDAANSVGLGRMSPESAVAVVLADNRRAFDVGRVEAADGTIRHYLCVLSSGFDSSANERANEMTWPSGTALYIRSMLAVLRTFRPIPYRAELDGEVVVDEGMIVSLGNGPAFGGGMLVCAGADMHDGLLDLIWVHSMPRRRFLAVFPKVYSGKHLQHPAVESRRVRSAMLDAPGQVAYADGERIAALPVTVTAVPDGVQVVVPR
ncbi:MAG TPA: YegS/Rv2252/BmrU family lipid kinase [Motilibacterales bacterium]|nr:YegS/Rv2252/BmrU family lipid kinase [Motilibacterales bacterium]